jgi:hypothetical protein
MWAENDVFDIRARIVQLLIFPPTLSEKFFSSVRQLQHFQSKFHRSNFVSTMDSVSAQVILANRLANTREGHNSKMKIIVKYFASKNEFRHLVDGTSDLHLSLPI